MPLAEKILRVGPWKSNPPEYDSGMKIKLSDCENARGFELVATFGRAQLVKRADGRFELRGGGPDERFEAREWASLFLHEAVWGERCARASALA